MIAQWWNAFVEAWDTIGRHVEVDLLPRVPCVDCGRRYVAWRGAEGEPVVQGSGICAWRLFHEGRWVVHCGYGSVYDLHEFWYIDKFPTEPADGICDWCIRRLLDAGVLMDSGKERSMPIRFSPKELNK